MSNIDKNIYQKPVLYQYFKKYVRVLLSKFDLSKEQQSNKIRGENREIFCNEFLSKVLPPRLAVKKNGEILDSFGSKTGELDIIIIRNDAPSLHYGQVDSFLVEGVFAVIEVKSNLTRTKLKEAIETLRKVKKLKSLNRTLMRVNNRSYLERPLRCIVAYEGASFEVIMNELVKEENKNVVDLICILQKGAIVRKGMILKWDNEKPFIVINGKAASLAILYLYLVTYSTSFLILVPDFSNYFQPLNGWIE